MLPIKKEQIYISTIASDASSVARQYGFGLEIAQYCTASNMDAGFPATHAALAPQLEGVSRRVLHGPFNELFPCAIDPKARELAAARYRQAIGLAQRYQAHTVVIHGGYHPFIYYPIWYVEQSILFWRDFLKEDPHVRIVLENVLEEEPEMLRDIVQGVNDPRVRMCLDIGHVNAYSRHSAARWLEVCAPYIGHFHIHNNDGSRDAHAPVNQGSIPMKAFLRQADALCPGATYTLELMEAADSVQWLSEESL